MTKKVRLDRNVVTDALASMCQMPSSGEWYLAEERANALTDALLDPESSSEVVVTTNEAGQCVAVTRQDDEGRILSIIWERPEVKGLSAEETLKEFAKRYPNDAGLVELAQNNREFMVDSIAARHRYAAFTAGVQAAERRYNAK